MESLKRGTGQDLSIQKRLETETQTKQLNNRDELRIEKLSNCWFNCKSNWVGVESIKKHHTFSNGNRCQLKIVEFLVNIARQQVKANTLSKKIEPSIFISRENSNFNWWFCAAAARLPSLPPSTHQVTSIKMWFWFELIEWVGDFLFNNTLHDDNFRYQHFGSFLTLGHDTNL